MRATMEKMMKVGKMMLVGVIGFQLCVMGLPQETQAWSLKKAFKKAVSVVTKPIEKAVNKVVDKAKDVVNSAKKTVQNVTNKAIQYAKDPGKLVKDTVNFVKKHKEEFLVGALTVAGGMVGIDPFTVRTLYAMGKQAYTAAKTGKFNANVLIGVGSGLIGSALGVNPATIEKAISMGQAAYQMAKKGKVDPNALLSMGVEVAKVAGVPASTIGKIQTVGQKAIAAHAYLKDPKNLKALKGELGTMFLNKALGSNIPASVRDIKTAQSWIRQTATQQAKSFLKSHTDQIKVAAAKAMLNTVKTGKASLGAMYDYHKALSLLNQAGNAGKTYLNTYKTSIQQVGAMLQLKKFEPIPTGWRSGPIPTGWRSQPVPTGWRNEPIPSGWRSGPIPTGWKPPEFRTIPNVLNARTGSLARTPTAVERPANLGKMAKGFGTEVLGSLRTDSKIVPLKIVKPNPVKVVSNHGSIKKIRMPGRFSSFARSYSAKVVFARDAAVRRSADNTR